MSDHEKFLSDCVRETREQGHNSKLQELTRDWFNLANIGKYSYHFSFLGLPIIQYPQDIVAVQELIWEIKPDLIIETGIARGGSLVMSAGMLAMLDYCEAVSIGKPLDPYKSQRKVIGIDIDIRAHNREAIQSHLLSHKIELVEGSSISAEVISKVRMLAADYKKILVILDSNHTHEHVLTELKNYADLVSVGSYCIVFDTVIDDMPDDHFEASAWGVGNNPKTAVKDFLKSRNDFIVDANIDDKLLISVGPGGYLKRIQ